MKACWPIRTTGPAKSVLIAIADRTNTPGHWCWASLTTLAEMTCMNERTVRRAITQLEAENVLKVDRSNGRNTRYLLLTRILETSKSADSLSGVQSDETVEITPKITPKNTPENTEDEQQNPGLSVLGEQSLTTDSTSTTNIPTPDSVSLDPGLSVQTPRTLCQKPRTQSPTNRIKPLKATVKSNRKEKALPEIELPDWLPAKAWAEWDEHRKNLDPKKWTALAKTKALKKLERLRGEGHNPVEQIDRGIECGWSSFFPEQKRSFGGANQRPKPKPLDWAKNKSNVINEGITEVSTDE